MNLLIKSSPRQLIVAGVLTLIYVALFALAGYLESIGFEDDWPTWVLWVAGVTWGAIMLTLPFLVVKYLGMDLSPLWRSLRRFSLRKMLLYALFISIFIWYLTQMQWSIQRSHWRTSSGPATRTFPGEAPLRLQLVGEWGVSRIEIKNGTKGEIAEAERLFPEAIVVAVPAVAPVEPQPTARK